MANVADSDPRWLKDGVLSFMGGADSSVPASSLSRIQVSSAVNTSFRRGTAKPRPAFIKRPLTFDTGLDSAFKKALFQDGGFYDGNGYPALISSHGGRIFKIDPKRYVVTEISPPGDANSSLLPKAWHRQVQKYWIITNNQSYPIIFDGSASRRADPTKNEIPVGNVIAESMGRIIIGLPDRITFRVGNLIFGDGTLENILRFDENNYLNEGGDFIARVFGAPSDSGEIRAIISGAMTNAQLGEGPCQVGTPNQVFTLNLPFDRTTWKNLSNALQTCNPIMGPLGQDSTVRHNSDLFYRALDGIRSYILAQREFGTDGNTSISGEVNDILEYDTQSLLEFGSAVVWENQLIHTISPVQSARGVWHRGFVVRDFEPEAATQRDYGAIWNGVWTGVRVLKVVSGMIDGVSRCFMYVLSDAQEIELWEMDSNRATDEGNVPISWSVDFPSLNCGDSDRFKTLQTGRVIISGLVGSLSVKVKYRTDLSPCYQLWDQFTVCAKYQDCDQPINCAPRTYREQQRTPVRFRMPPDDFDPTSGIRYRTGFEFQPRLEMLGYAEIRQLRIYTLDTPESLARERSAAEKVINVPTIGLIDAGGSPVLDANGNPIFPANFF